MQEITYVTGNSGKFEEVKRFFARHMPSLAFRRESLEITEIQSNVQLDIALDKARQAWQKLKKPVLVEDAGIYFDRYDNFPGAFTKFVYLGIGIEGLLKLVEKGDKATFVLHLIYLENYDTYHVFKGECKGSIVVPKGLSAHPELPYDDIFKPDGCEKSYAQLRGTDEFEDYAYRVDALKKFLSWLKKK